jgi:hypothetical protein
VRQAHRLPGRVSARARQLRVSAAVEPSRAYPVLGLRGLSFAASGCLGGAVRGQRDRRGAGLRAQAASARGARDKGFWQTNAPATRAAAKPPSRPPAQLLPLCAPPQRKRWPAAGSEQRAWREEARSPCQRRRQPRQSRRCQHQQPRASRPSAARRPRSGACSESFPWLGSERALAQAGGARLRA